MLDTNQLLSIGFAMVSNFASVVGIPQSSLPHQTSDLDRLIIGSPSSPVAMYMSVARSGSEFGINNGVVNRYSSTGSFFRLLDPADVPKFMGSTALTVPDAIRIASNAIWPLIKAGNPLVRPPRVRFGGSKLGTAIPFFEIVWPQEGSGADMAAKVEIDGRSERIVDVHLWGPSFGDRAFERELRNKVHAPERVKLDPLRGYANLPKPTTNYVTASISRWLLFCARLGLEPGEERSTSAVNWQMTYLYESTGLYTNGVCVTPACHVAFRNGASFDVVADVVFRYAAADVAFGVGRFQFEPFEGEPRKRWEDLASSLESSLVAMMQMPMPLFASLKPRRFSPESVTSGKRLTRARVCWCSTDYSPWVPDSDQLHQEASSPLMVEFDLVTGGVKFIWFKHPEINDPIWRGLRTIGTAR